MDLNRVMLAGNLTRDPVMNQISAGSAVTRFGLAINQRYTTRDGDKREDICFVDVDVWGKQAEQCEQYLVKGAPVFVEGRLLMNQWEDRDTGQRRQRLSIRADRVHFLSFRGNSSNGRKDEKDSELKIEGEYSQSRREPRSRNQYNRSSSRRTG